MYAYVYPCAEITERERVRDDALTHTHTHTHTSYGAECACERVCLGHGFLAIPSSFVLKIDVTIMVDLFLNA